MDRRHFPNSYRGDHQNHRNRATGEHSYIQRGRAAIPNNRLPIHQMNNVSMGGSHKTTHWNSKTGNYNSSSSRQVPPEQPSFQGPPYNPFPQSSQNNYPSHNHRSHINHNHGPQEEYVPRNDGALKRKGPETSGSEVNSSSHRFYAGSSSSSFEYPYGKSSSHIDYGPKNSSFFAGEGSSRNVRSRSAFNLEANYVPTHASNHSSHYHPPPNNPPNYDGEPDPRNLNGVGNSQNWNFGTMIWAARGGVQTAGASSLNHGSNQRNYRSGSISGMAIAPSSQYVCGPIQDTRGRSSHYGMEIPSYSNGLSYYPMRNEPTSTEDCVYTHIPSSYNHLSRSARGWGDSYSSRTSGIAIERFRSFNNVVDAHGGIGYEDLMIDLPTFYASSHHMFDQYQDMRLDIDDMSYEELLALGDSIGNVNTGLSGDIMSSSLSEETYSSMQNNMEESCAICLEEYANGAEVGKLKNCGHNYHAKCIKKWLSMKNVCPICKASAHKNCVMEE